MVDLSIVIATHNGQGVLGRVLEGYEKIQNGDDNWKLIIVDNASTDDTAKIIHEFSNRLPIKYIFVPDPGKNGALNAGLREIEGSIIILSDDDAIPQPGFLNAWRDAFERLPQFDIFGGAIHLEFDAPAPGWLLRRELKFEELYAIRKNVIEGPIHPLKIYGPNMAVRRKVFDEGLTFNSSIGPNSADAKYAMGSENDFCTRAAEKGYTTGFTPQPLVFHIVRPHQMTREYWANRAYKLGRGAAKQQWDSGKLVLKDRPPLVELAAQLVRLTRRSIQYLTTFVPGNYLNFMARWEFGFGCGFSDENARQKRIRKEERRSLPSLEARP